MNPDQREFVRSQSTRNDVWYKDRTKFIYGTKILEGWNGRTLRTAKGESVGGHFESRENPKKSRKKLKKIKNKVLAGKPNGHNAKDKKRKKNKKERGSRTNLNWSERCRRAARVMGIDPKSV